VPAILLVFNNLFLIVNLLCLLRVWYIYCYYCNMETFDCLWMGLCIGS